MKPICIAFILALALTGCAEKLARLVAYDAELEAAAVNYVRTRNDVRQEIRKKCEEGLWREYDALVAESHFADARRLMSENYPPLLTVTFIKEYRSGGDLAAIDRPWGCQAVGE